KKYFKDNSPVYTTIGSSTCGYILDPTLNYLLSKEKVYLKYTPITSGLINLNLTMCGSNNLAGLFIYDGLANLGTTCVAGVTTGSSLQSANISNFYAATGHDYYILI